jgi:hypothetical protein
MPKNNADKIGTHVSQPIGKWPHDESSVSPSLILHIGEASIELHSRFDPMLLREVIHALTSPC